MSSHFANQDLDAPVLAEKRGQLGLLTLNRPRAINALTTEMVDILTRTLEQWTDDADVETVVLQGAGDRGLCAGGDIVSIHRDAVSGGTGSLRFWESEYQLNAFIAEYPKPYVALMDGLVLGGGVGVSAHARHRVVTERTRIGMPETGIGFVPDVGGTWLLSRAPGELGTHVALTAGHIDAGDAIALGLADHQVASSDLSRLVTLLEDRPFASALALVVQASSASRLLDQEEWINDAYSGDDLVAIVKAINGREEPEAAEAARAIARNSPIALAVTLRALREARQMETLREALDQEFRIAARMLRGHDFPEGIRAQVIEKDRNPRWSPASIDDVTPEQVAGYFAPLSSHELEGTA